MSITFIILICLVMAVSGVVQGFTGFGFAIVAMALLPFLADFKTVFSVVALVSVVIPFITFANTRKGYKVKAGLVLAYGAVIGTVMGFPFMNNNLGEPFFMRLFGVVLILFSILDIILARAFRLQMPKWMGWPLGIAGGFCGAAFNIGGPPMAVYVHSQNWTKQQIIATLQVASICSMALRLVLMHQERYFDWTVLKLVGITLIPVAIGVFYGTKLLHLLPQRVVKICVFSAVGLLGLKYLIMGQ